MFWSRNESYQLCRLIRNSCPIIYNKILSNVVFCSVHLSLLGDYVYLLDRVDMRFMIT